MSTRKYSSGYEKLKKKRQREELIESQKGLWTNLLLVKNKILQKI